MTLWRAASILSLLASLLGVLLLGKLDYSSSWITACSEAEVASPPNSDALVGNLAWRYEVYEAASELEAYRLAFEACRPLDGIQAARCAFEVLKRTPLAEPKVEFVDPHYDAAAALRDQLEGRGGHCTTRSALSATAMLALGKPARVAQLFPAEGKGHTVVEVFDRELGWVVFDPSEGDTLVDSEGRPHSGVSLQGGAEVRWRTLGGGRNVSKFRFATVVYPDPWLYTRLGVKRAPWPFRGAFVRLGDRRLDLGPLQHACLGAVLLFSSLGAVSLFMWLHARRQPRKRASEYPTGGVPTDGLAPETQASGS